MSEEMNLRKIAVSQEVFDKMSEEFIERLKGEEKIEIIILGKPDLTIQKLRALDVTGVILASDEVQNFEKELELQEKVMEYNMPENIEKVIEQMDKLGIENYLPERHVASQKQKYYVPRTIGKPNSKKKGGR